MKTYNAYLHRKYIEQKELAEARQHRQNVKDTLRLLAFIICTYLLFAAL